MHKSKSVYDQSASSRAATPRLASALGLSAGAVGVAELAQAADAEPSRMLNTLVMPDAYEQVSDDQVLLRLSTGEQLSLTSDQFVILDVGLLLVVDELAQASVYGLPVMGSIRAQLISDLAPVATIDGTVAEAMPSQTLAIIEGTAPRLSEHVDLQSYEVAQSSVDDTNTAGDALATSMAVAPDAMALLGMLMTSDQPEAETPTPPAPPAPPPEPEFWTDADIADSASTAITGSSADSFVGYTAASTAAATSALTNVGRGSGNVATFDMSAGGDNFFVARDNAAFTGGSLSYTGGSGDDSLTFDDFLAEEGNATFDMSLGGDNTLVAGGYACNNDGSIIA